MRCPDCSKMVSYDEPQATVESEEVSNEGLVNIEVRLVLPCAECGTELKETTFNFEIDLEHTCENRKTLCECGHSRIIHDPLVGCLPQETQDKICECKQFQDLGEIGFEIETDNPETTEEYKPQFTTNKKGEQKPVPMRYQKHYWGVLISGVATCNKCGEEIPFDDKDDIQASGMEELT